MSWDEMYPQHNCKKCNKALNPDGHKPAELYAGTYTGLCYACQNSGPYVVKQHFDGAMTLSYPPHSPSWRRDREEHFTYADCVDCEGKGRHYVSRPNPLGGSYYRYCATCLNRYCGHPKREWASQRYRTIDQAAQAVWEAQLRQRRLITKARKGLVPQELVDEIKAPILARYDVLVKRHKAMREVKGL